jgi:hypothetical protein
MQPSGSGYSSGSGYNDPRYNVATGSQYDVSANQPQQPQYDRNQQFGYGSQPNTNHYGQPSQGGWQPGFAGSQAMIAARPAESQMMTPPATNNFPPAFVGSTLAANNAAPVQGATAVVTTPSATVQSLAGKTTEESPPAKSSSAPLILTTLALFASLGVNTYLGWLAYSFFWRYRDAVSDSVRARSQYSPGRQAA